MPVIFQRVPIFLFGFDTVVISGADKQLQELWNTKVSASYFGGVMARGSGVGGGTTGDANGPAKFCKML